MRGEGGGGRRQIQYASYNTLFGNMRNCWVQAPTLKLLELGEGSGDDKTNISHYIRKRKDRLGVNVDNEIGESKGGGDRGGGGGG